MNIITTKFVPATNTKGSRIKVSGYRGDKLFSYDYAAETIAGPHKVALEDYVAWMNEEDLKLGLSGTKFVIVNIGLMPDGCSYGATIDYEMVK